MGRGGRADRDGRGRAPRPDRRDRRHHPRVRFGVGPIRERLPLAGIADARPARDRWLYGQGIRTPHGGLHDVSG